MTAFISVQNLSYEISGKKLIQDVDLSLSPGDCLGIVGPNGAGKSTLMRLLSGFWTPSSGSVLIQGIPFKQVSIKERAQQIAVVNPREGLPPFPMTVLDYLKLGRAPYQDWLGSWSIQDQDALDAALKICHLESFLDERLHNLSSGEWQRVQLGRAFCQTPQLLLLDEPTSHLDVSAQIDIMGLLKQFTRQGNILITVLHDLNLAAQYMDQVLLLNQGQSVVLGSPGQVFTLAYLASVYQLKWDIRVHPETGCPVLLPDYPTYLD